MSHAGIKVEPRPTSRLSSTRYIIPLFYLRDKNLQLFTCVYTHVKITRLRKSTLREEKRDRFFFVAHKVGVFNKAGRFASRKFWRITIVKCQYTPESEFNSEGFFNNPPLGKIQTSSKTWPLEPSVVSTTVIVQPNARRSEANQSSKDVGRYYYVGYLFPAGIFSVVR